MVCHLVNITALQFTTEFTKPEVQVPRVESSSPWLYDDNWQSSGLPGRQAEKDASEQNSPLALESHSEHNVQNTPLWDLEGLMDFIMFLFNF